MIEGYVCPRCGYRVYIDGGGRDCFYCESCESVMLNEAEYLDRAAHEDDELSEQAKTTNDTNNE